MNNQQVTHGPAQKVGNMRVSRKPFKRKSVKQQLIAYTKEDFQSDSYHTDTEIESDIEYSDIEDLTDDDEEEERMNQLNIQELQNRQSREMKAHVASRKPDISSNPGSNAKQIYNSNPQQRGLSH